MSAKRLFDIGVSSVGLALLAVPFVAIASIVAIGSRGPVIYRQQRIGRHGRPFTLYKFRTMRIADGGAQVTTACDARITRVGQVLRRWKLDELPQLWNVLRGDMSIIGPRPEVARFVDRYTPAQRRVLDERPGLAGMAQLVYPHESDLLRGSRDPEDAYVTTLMPRKLAVDLDYARRRTFWSDLSLLVKIALLVAGRCHRIDRDLRMTSGGRRPV